MDGKEFRDVSHQVVDLLADYLEGIESKRVFPDVEPGTVNRLFAEPLPEDGASPDSVLAEHQEHLLPD